MNKTKKILAAVIILMLCVSMAACGNGDKKPDPGEEELRQMTYESVYKEGVSLDSVLWQEPEYYYHSEMDKTADGIKALYIKVRYMDYETYAFAYLGIPDSATETDKVPGVLLLHGGAGTAYYDWVKLWKNKGYAALAVDLEGRIPQENGTMDKGPSELYQKSQYTAPHNQNHSDSSLPIEETWMYYAVQTAIISNSFLHSLDVVDEYKIGVCGVSWGGVLTSIVTGYDDRFAFSIPIYCSLNLADSFGLPMATRYNNYPAARVWDDPNGLYAVNTPICVIASNVDRFGALDSMSATYEGCKNAVMVTKKGMLHAQGIAAGVYEAYNFADSIVKDRAAFPKVTQEPDKNGTTVKVKLETGVTITEAYLVYTQDSSLVDATWSQRRANVLLGDVSYTIPEGTTAFYIAMDDNKGNTVSTKTVLYISAQDAN